MTTISKIFTLLILSGHIALSSVAQTPPDNPSNQANQDSTKTEGGIAVTPSHLYFSTKPGQNKSQTIKVSNNTRKAQKFELKFGDFEMSAAGKSGYSKTGSNPNSFSNWISFSPTFFEVLPGQSQKVTVSLNIPDEPSAYHAKWGILFINQAVERKTIDITPGDNRMAMGVIPSYGFGIYIYQNPPNVAVKKVDIISFSNISKPADSTIVLELKAKNIGDGISHCTSYAEIINTSTGKKQRLGKKMFTVLPDHERKFIFEIPRNIEKGRYTVLGVLDFGSKEELQAAELEFTVE